MWISPAYAQAAGGDGGTGMWVQLLPLVLIFVVFYFLLIRPQQKKMKTHQQMLEALRRGDRVVTSGGIIGTITRIDSEREVTLEIAQNVRVKVMRGMISEVMAKPEPADAKASESKSSESKAAEADNKAE